MPGKNDITVYGLEDVNRVIHPAVLKYTGYDSASLMVTATTPVKGEASFVKWLEDRKKEKVCVLEPQEAFCALSAFV